ARDLRVRERRRTKHAFNFATRNDQRQLLCFESAQGFLAGFAQPFGHPPIHGATAELGELQRTTERSGGDNGKIQGEIMQTAFGVVIRNNFDGILQAWAKIASENGEQESFREGGTGANAKSLFLGQTAA